MGTDTQQDTNQVVGTVPWHHCHWPDGTFCASAGTLASLSTAGKQPISLCPLLLRIKTTLHLGALTGVTF